MRKLLKLQTRFFMNMDEVEEYENFEDISSEELEIWISENDELIREEMYEIDYTIKQISIENDDNN